MIAINSELNLDFTFRWPYNCLCVGSSLSGKSTFVARLLTEQKHLLDVQPDTILYCYGQYSKNYEKLREEHNNLQLISGLPFKEVEDIKNRESNAEINDSKKTLLIIDDCSIEILTASGGRLIQECFTRLRHCHVSTILILHNFFAESPLLRTVRRNAVYLILFKVVQDKAVLKSISSKYFDGKLNFLPNALEQLTRVNPHAYLCLDLRPNCNELLRVSANIFNEDLKQMAGRTVFLPA